MAIRLSEIPNAPGAGNPTSLTPVLNPGYMPRTSPVADIPRNAALDSSSLVQAAAQLKLTKINPDDMNAGILALQDFGQSVSKASQVSADFGVKLLRGQNAADLARADVIMRDAQTAHATKIAELPEDKWAESWEESLGDVKKQISGLGLSDAATADLTPDFMRWEASTRGQITVQAVKARIDNNRLAVNTAAERAFLSGDMGLASRHYEEAVATGLMSDEEADAEIIRFEQEAKQQSYVTLLNSDPQKMLDETGKAMDSGKPPSFAPEMNPEQVRRFNAAAESALNQRKQDASDQLDDAIFGGHITEEKVVRDLGKAAGLNERVIASHLSAMEKVQDATPAGMAKTLKSHSELMTAIEGYDPASDPKAIKQTELLMTIRANIPPGLRESLVDELRARRKEGIINPDEELRSMVNRQIDKLITLGVFGPTKKKPTDTKEDPDLQKAVFQKSISLKTGFKTWQKDNPKATPDQIQEWFTGETNRYIIENGVKINKEDRFHAWDLFAPAALVRAGGRAYDYLENRKESLSMPDRIKAVDEALDMPYDENGSPNITTNADPNGLTP